MDGMVGDHCNSSILNPPSLLTEHRHTVYHNTWSSKIAVKLYNPQQILTFVYLCDVMTQ